MFEDELVVHLPNGESDLQKEFLTTAIYQKLAKRGLQLSDVPSLIPFFKEGGWPLQQDRTVGHLKVALRLNEPEEDSEEWLLETVILSSSSSKHWTPAVRKRHLPMNEALPDKWKNYSEEIRQTQKQMLELLMLDNVSDESFLHMPLSDAEVRTLLRDKFVKLTALDSK